MGQLQTKKIYVHQLEPGMYVSGLDRPWLETPFYLQGFMIRNAGEVQKLSLYCDYVYVDYEKSITSLNVEVSHKLSHNRKLGIAATPFTKELGTRRIVKYDEQLAVTEEGLPKKELTLLSMGGMLLDIGKLKIPGTILNKTEQLSEREFTLVKKHVELSLKMVESSSRTLPQAVIDMISSHHERFNGGGYPRALQGTQIPLYARIAAIADCYDAVTSQRVYAQPIPHALAIKKMYEWRGYDFQPELIEAFIQSVGVYPTGTLVELSSGAVGIVIKENPGKRLRPQVLIILDSDKQQLPDFQEVNLADPSGSIDILRTLEPGAYGLDPEALYI